jgi:hypothetical protein
VNIAPPDLVIGLDRVIKEEVAPEITPEIIPATPDEPTASPSAE